ncbi:DNA topoisomerase III [Giardia muris]|uniref:DNA topoisomerase n=1 Tax=Giardia muris TaxID=5742 RepID=A0A4Z1TCC5_GIAMU|nr:DNA topoisomerase III [Giardia muris]|eukprot:TNJ30141.1 DNA topoisomerase III [Giardia muris]
MSVSPLALCIAEKHAVARELARLLDPEHTNAGGTGGYHVYRVSRTLSGGGKEDTLISHTIGHETELVLPPEYDWGRCSPEDLFTAPVVFKHDVQFIRAVVQPYLRQITTIYLMADADREGENISYDVIEAFALHLTKDVILDVCPARLPVLRPSTEKVRSRILAADVSLDTQRKHVIRVLRVRFSALNGKAIEQAFRDAGPLDMNVVNAVDLRRIIDLRIGYSITRLQTQKLRGSFEAVAKRSITSGRLTSHPISYGPCQIPTLGLVHNNDLLTLELFKQPALKLELCGVPILKERRALGIFSKQYSDSNQKEQRFVLKKQGRTPEVSLLDSLPQIKKTLDSLNATKNIITISCVKSLSRTVRRPCPMATIDLQRQLARQYNSLEVMHAAEELYTRGFISYPRTETRRYPSEYSLSWFRSLLEKLQREYLAAFSSNDELITQRMTSLCSYIHLLLNSSDFPMQLPRTDSSSTDNAHLPIHPQTFLQQKLLRGARLSSCAQSVYFCILRGFLASLAPDCLKRVIEMTTDLNGIEFMNSHEEIIEPGFLRILQVGAKSEEKTQDTRTGMNPRLDVKEGDKFLVIGAPFKYQPGTNDFNIVGTQGNHLLVSQIGLDTANAQDDDSHISITSTPELSEEEQEPNPKHEAQSNMALNMDLKPIAMPEGALLSEMDSHGIGTDATMAEHIDNIRVRAYVTNERAITPLGAALLEFYKGLPSGIQALSCAFRCFMEHGMQLICAGEIDPHRVYDDCIAWGQRFYTDIASIPYVSTSFPGSYDILRTIQQQTTHRIPVSSSSRAPRFRGTIKCCGEPCKRMRLRLVCNICGTHYAVPTNTRALTPLLDRCPHCAVQLVSLATDQATLARFCLRCRKAP